MTDDGDDRRAADGEGVDGSDVHAEAVGSCGDGASGAAEPDDAHRQAGEFEGGAAHRDAAAPGLALELHGRLE